MGDAENVTPMRQDPFADLERLGGFGEAGAQPTEQEVTYGVVTYFGRPLRVVTDPLSLELTLEEFLDFASMLDGEEDPRAVGAVRAFMRCIIHPDDFTGYWNLVRQHRQDVTKQMAFGKYVIELVTGRPTGLPSDSSGGRQTTTANSEDDLSLRVQRRLEASGRPDLAEVVLKKREYDQQHAS
jgi:hypothetical protein